VLCQKGCHGPQLIGLAAPSVVLGGRAEHPHLLKKAAITLYLVQGQLEAFYQIPHVLQGFWKLQAGVDEEHLRASDGFSGQDQAGQAVLSTAE